VRERALTVFEAVVERLSIHTPDLDDVFLAVTGSHVTVQSNEKPALHGVPKS
jgi:hypothetical protein